MGAFQPGQAVTPCELGAIWLMPPPPDAMLLKVPNPAFLPLVGRLHVRPG
jgi:hypothetical protein